MREISWLGVGVRSLVLLLTVAALPFVFLLVAAITGASHGMTMFFYNLTFSVVPGADPRGDNGLLTRAFSGWNPPGPYVVWLAVAAAFGWCTRRQSLSKSAAIGLLVLLATVAAFRLLYAAMGWTLLVDTM